MGRDSRSSGRTAVLASPLSARTVRGTDRGETLMAHSMGTTAPDLQAIKARQQATWASGDFSVVASRIVIVAEQLCDTADLHAGWHVLDVATGSGNAAIAAARCGC